MPAIGGVAINICDNNTWILGTRRKVNSNQFSTIDALRNDWH
jgi:hypothetical protein